MANGDGVGVEEGASAAAPVGEDIARKHTCGTPIASVAEGGCGAGSHREAM
jgi:hypothetical protein